MICYNGAIKNSTINSSTSSDFYMVADYYITVVVDFYMFAIWGVSVAKAI